MKKVISAVFILLMLLNRVPAQNEKIKLTPEEEHEASAIAEDFVKRIESDEDLASTGNVLFVKNYAARLRVKRSEYLAVDLTPELWSTADASDITRLYLSHFRITYYNYILYGASVLKLLRKNKDAKIKDEDIDVKSILPPELLARIKREPFLSKTWTFFSDKQNVSDKDDNKIASVEQLRNYLRFLDEAFVLIKKHLGSLSLPQTWKGLAEENKKLKPESGDEQNLLKPKIYIQTFDNDSDGYKAGTRMIGAEILIFALGLVKEDGKWKILHLSIHD